MQAHAGDSCIQVTEGSTRGLGRAGSSSRAGSSGEGDQTKAKEQHDVHTQPLQPHRLSSGGEHIPPTPLDSHMAILVIACSLFVFFSGVIETVLGIIVNGLIAVRGSRNGPPLWWSGWLPLFIGMYGISASVKKKRRWVLKWGIAALLVVVTQTAIMGVVGNFTTSHYDVWPSGYRQNEAICTHGEAACYCQDYYHAEYSLLELPEVRYLYINGTKWRETRYSECKDVFTIATLYYTYIACHGVLAIFSILACIFGFAGSVCAPYNFDDFQKFENEEDVEKVANITEDGISHLKCNRSTRCKELTTFSNGTFHANRQSEKKY